MTRDLASLHRRPFLTPIWLTVAFAFCAVGVLVFSAWMWGTADSTTIVVIRHAEKEVNAGGDPPLSSAGRARAELLSTMFGARDGAGRLDAIYVTSALRNKMTAAPLAARLGIEPVVVPGANPRGLARRVMREHTGGKVLVVGHGDTVNAIVAAFSETSGLTPIGDDEYSIMYIVSVPQIGRSNVLRLRY